MNMENGFHAGSMQAAILEGPAQLRIDRVSVPEPGPGELRVRLEGCGVCASNVEPWAGQPWSTYPGEPGGLGHEGWGVVDALGEGADGFAIGDRVAALGRGPARTSVRTGLPSAMSASGHGGKSVQGFAQRGKGPL